MAIVKLLAFASCWPVLIQAEAVEDVMPAGDDVDDECASPGCALQALQSRAKTVSIGPRWTQLLTNMRASRG